MTRIGVILHILLGLGVVALSAYAMNPDRRVALILLTLIHMLAWIYVALHVILLALGWAWMPWATPPKE